jgi:hypothetical protein
MTAAQLLHFFIVIVLGILAFITFLVAGTILGLMIVEDLRCNCVQYPIGLYVLGALWLLLLIGVIREVIDGPFFTLHWIRRHREALIITAVIFFALLLIL